MPDRARLALVVLTGFVLVGSLAASPGPVAAAAPTPAGSRSPAPISITAPAGETTWENGVISGIADGDTVYVDVKEARDPGFIAPPAPARSYCSNRIGASGGLPRGGLVRCRVRIIGIQAPEKAGAAGGSALQQCRATLATAQIRALLSPGTKVKLRALQGTSREDQYSGGRLARTVYYERSPGVWVDVGAKLLASGYLMWFPFGPADPEKPETAHNLEYRTIVDRAAAAKRGLWSANLCGPSPAAAVSVSVVSDPIGDDSNNEYAIVTNHAPAALDLSGWVVRDSSLTTFTFPPGTVLAPGRFVRVWSGTGPVPLPPGDFAFGGAGQLFANWSTSPGVFSGDAAYLFDRQEGFSSGNLRAWVHLPCTGAGCADPLVGKVLISKVRYNPPGPDTPGGEHVELVNKSAEVVRLAGYALTRRGAQFAIPPTTELAPGATLRIVVGRGKDRPGVVHMGRTATLLANSGDLVALARLDNATVDCRAWGSFRCDQLPAPSPLAPAPAAAAQGRVKAATPNAPVGTVAGAESRRIVVGWQPPAKAKGTPVTSYRVTVTRMVGGRAQKATTCTVSAPTQSCQTGTLKRKRTYSVSVRAGNAKGYGKASAGVAVRIP